MTTEPKLCRACGREIEPRRSHRGRRPVYCSQRCRQQRISPRDREIEAALSALLDQRQPGASLCPSEVARAVRPDDWRPLMEPVRRAVRRMAARGLVEVLQSGRTVDPARARGPIRVRRVRGENGA